MANIITTLSLEMSENWYVSKKLNSVGRVGENTVTKLIIEPTEILDNVTYEIEIMSADGSKNVAELTIDGTELYLILTANMLTTSGIMKMQVRGLFTDGSIKKSNIFELKVNRSISATEHYEEYAVTIFDQLVQDCRDIIEGAESYVVRAETAAVNAEAYEQSASASAEAASASATSAASSASNASNSATSATTAASNAATSETNAAASAASASTSAANANTSATNAANSATSAATSATNAHNSEVNASTSETNASTSATEAAASAESIAASVAQINENTYRINDLEAIIAGYQLADLPTGTVASVTDGTALLMPSLKVGIEPAQDLHGYEHPWAGGAGKNKLQVTATSQTADGITFTINNDGTINVNGTATQNVSLLLSRKNVSYTPLPEGQLTMTGCPSGGSTSSYYLTCWRTNSGNANDVGSGVTFGYRSDWDFVVSLVIASGTTCNNLIFKPMIRLATETDPTYEPYSNICPISGWTAAKVTRTGKNILRLPTYKEVITYPRTNGYYNIPIKVIPNASYYLSTSYLNGYSSIGTGMYALISEAKYNVRYESIAHNVKGKTDGILTANAEGYLYLNVVCSASTWNTLCNNVQTQLELGDTATTYEPYNSTTYNIQFTDGTNPLTVYGGTLDAVSGELTVTDAHIASYDSETLPSTWISDRDVYAEGTTPTTGAEVVYKLANSVTYHLTPTQIRTLVGNNNIWADTGNIISGKYFRSLT